MNILQKLTLADIRHHKGSFVVTVISVLLSTALVATVLLGIDSVMASMRGMIVSQSGDYDWMGTGEKVGGSNSATLDNLESSGLFSKLGYACDLTGVQDSDYGRVDIIGVGGDTWELLGAVVAEGNLPTAENEVAIYADFAKQNNLSVGGTLTLSGNDESGHTLIITALIEQFHIDNHFVFSKDAPAALILTSLATPPENSQIYYWGQASSYDTKTLQALLSLDTSLSSSDASIFNGWLNTSLLAWSGVHVPVDGENLLTLIGALRLFLLLLITVAAVLMIYNSFSISLAERRRNLGILSSMGATPYQRLVYLLYEAFAAGVLGIPLGLVVSCVGLYLSFSFITPLIQQVSELYVEDFMLSLSVRPLWLILSAAIALGVLLISAWRPALHASKISSIDAIRGLSEVKLSRRTLKGGQLFGRVFGPEYIIARKNSRRSIHRYRATLLSLTMSVILMVTASGFTQYLETAYLMGHQDSDYNITARLDSYDLTTDITDNPAWNTLVSPKNAQKVKMEETIQWGAVSLPTNRFSEQQQSLITENFDNNTTDFSQVVNADGSLSMSPCLIVLSDEEYSSLTGAVATSDGKTLDCLLVNRYLFTGAKGGYTDVQGQTNFQSGDTIEWDFNTVPITLKIGMVLDGNNVPEDLVRRIPSATTITFVSSRSAVDKVFEYFTAETGGYCRRNFTFSYLAENREALMEELGALSFGSNYYALKDQTAELANLSSGLVLVRVVVYGFTMLITLVCAANITNTVSRGMTLRRREFSILRSVGMDPKGLRSMIFWESGIYGLKALVWGLPISCILLWVVYRKLAGLYTFTFFLPWQAAIIAGIAMILLSLAAAWPTLRKAEHTSPASDLRLDE